MHSWEHAWEDAGVQQLGTEIPAPFPVLATALCSRRAAFAGTLWKTPEKANFFSHTQLHRISPYTKYLLDVFSLNILEVPRGPDISSGIIRDPPAPSGRAHGASPLPFGGNPTHSHSFPAIKSFLQSHLPCLGAGTAGGRGRIGPGCPGFKGLLQRFPN